MKEDDKQLQQLSLVSIGAENKVLVQDGAKVQERAKQLDKEGTKFSNDHCWFQRGMVQWRTNLVRNRHKYKANSAKNRHKDRMKGESNFQFPLIIDQCRNNMFTTKLSFCFSSFKNVQHNNVKVSNIWSMASRKNLSFQEKLQLMKSGKFQWIKIGRVGTQFSHLQV